MTSLGRPSDEHGRHKHARVESSSATAAELKELGLAVSTLLESSGDGAAVSNMDVLRRVMDAANVLLAASDSSTTHRCISLRLFLSVLHLCLQDARLVQRCIENFVCVTRDAALCAMLLCRDAHSLARSNSAGALTRASSARHGSSTTLDRCVLASRSVGAAAARYHSSTISVSSIVAPLFDSSYPAVRPPSSSSREDRRGPNMPEDDSSFLVRMLLGLALADGILGASPKPFFTPSRGAARVPYAPPADDFLFRRVEDVLVVGSLMAASSREHPHEDVFAASGIADIAWTVGFRFITTVIHRSHAAGRSLDVVVAGGLSLASWWLQGTCSSACRHGAMECLGALSECMSEVFAGKRHEGQLPPDLAGPTVLLLLSIVFCQSPPASSPEASSSSSVADSWSRLWSHYARLTSAAKAVLTGTFGDVVEGAFWESVEAVGGPETFLTIMTTRVLRHSWNLSAFVYLVDAIPRLGSLFLRLASPLSPSLLHTVCAIGLWNMDTAHLALVPPPMDLCRFVLGGGLIPHQPWTSATMCVNEEVVPAKAVDLARRFAQEMDVSMIETALLTPAALLQLFLQSVLFVSDEIARSIASIADRIGREVFVAAIVDDDAHYMLVRSAVEKVVRGHPMPPPGHRTAVLLAQTPTNNSMGCLLHVLSTFLQEQSSSADIIHNNTVTVVRCLRLAAVVCALSTHETTCMGDWDARPLLWGIQRMLPWLVHGGGPHRDAMHVALNWVVEHVVRQVKAGATITDAELMSCVASAQAAQHGSQVRQLFLRVVGCVLCAPSLSSARMTVVLDAAAATLQSSDAARQLILQSLVETTSPNDGDCLSLLQNRGESACLALLRLSVGVLLSSGAVPVVSYPLAVALLRNVMDGLHWSVDVVMDRCASMVIPAILSDTTDEGPGNSQWMQFLRIFAPLPQHLHSASSIGGFGAVLCRHHADQLVAAAVAQGNLPKLQATALPKASFLPAAIACCIAQCVSPASNSASPTKNRGKVVEDVARAHYHMDLATVIAGCEHNFTGVIIGLLSLLSAPLGEGWQQPRSTSPVVQEEQIAAAHRKFADALNLVCGIGALSGRASTTISAAAIDRACAQQAKAAAPEGASSSSSRAPSSSATSPQRQRLLKCLFDILHTMLKRIHFEDDGAYVANAEVPLCASTMRRWLLALVVFTRHLGEDVVQLFQKLPAILHFAARVGSPALLYTAALMWHELVRQLPCSFLETNIAAVMSELVALEAVAAHAPEAVAWLREAAQRLYASTSKASFWNSCLLVLANSEVARAASTSVGKLGSADPAKVLTGFSEAMTSGASSTCRVVFLRGLCDYLGALTPGMLLKCSDIAASLDRLHLYHILSSCLRTATLASSHAHRDRDTAPTLAAKCLGMLGGPAMQLQPLLNREDHGAHDKADVSRDVFLEHAFSWRCMLHTLLGTHLVRALASTSDSSMHDRAALSTQLLLRCGVKHERRESRGMLLLDNDRVYVDELERYSWWTQLPPLTRTLISPFTSTKYTPFIRAPRAVSVPEFNSSSEALQSVDDWLFSWYCNLAQRVTTTFVGEVAAACRNTAKKDDSLRDALLPHLVLTIIVATPSIPSDISAVITEFDAVLRAAGTHPGHAQRAITLLDSIEDVLTFCKLFLKKQARSLEKCTVDRDVVTQWTAALMEFFRHESLSIEARSRAASACGYFHRSLRALDGRRNFCKPEESIAANPQMLAAYAALGDHDVAAHLSRVGCSSTLNDAFALEQTCQWDLAKRAAERHLQHDPNSSEHQLCLVRCMRHLGETHLAARYARSLLPSGPSMELIALGEEASWRMGEWDPPLGRDRGAADNLVPDTRCSVPSLAAPVRALVSTARDRSQYSTLLEITDNVRRSVLQRLVSMSTSGDTTEKALHEDLCMLADIETAGKHFHLAGPMAPERLADEMEKHGSGGSPGIDGCGDLLTFLIGRADRSDATTGIKETLLSLRRVLFTELGRTDVASRAWVEEARTLRKRSRIDAALQAIQHATEHLPISVGYYSEAAKLWHLQDAVRGIEFAEAVVRSTTHRQEANKVPDKVVAKMILYATKWKHEVASQPEEEVVASYQRALDMHDCAKGHLFMAQFYDGLYEQLTSSVTPPPGAAAATAIPGTAARGGATGPVRNTQTDTYVALALRHYVKSLVHSTKASSMVMPRAMTIWLEYSAVLAADAAAAGVPANVRSKMEATIAELNQLVEAYFAGDAPPISAVVTMHVLPQLTSRLAHVHQGTTSVISKILLTLLSVCPQQVLWGLLPVVRSIKQARRASVAKQQVAQPFQRRGTEEASHLDAVSVVFNTLLDICNAAPEAFSDPRVRLTQMPFVRKVEKSIATSRCILPISVNMSPDWSLRVVPEQPTFTAFDDQVEVMSSLQKPKRIAVIGSDGVKYPFLCKAKDDPKKDIRMMEIVTRMNRMFMQDPESRKRQHRLRGYVVAALGDDYAIIEWVAHQTALRRSVEDAYSVDGTGIRTSTVRGLLAKVDAKQITRMEMFHKHILVDAKPVFHQWFHHRFEDPARWFAARQRYTVSCALWCAVGHIVGLGDRHGENMLIDGMTGEAMHVDFACMFDKGETLQEPERVRFRLTQNVVDALGVLGVDGGFRSTLTTALRTQVQNKSAIMCVLETLLHDPLIEWGDRSKADPRQLFHRVRRRLDGYVDLNARLKEWDVAPHDVAHQASRLIQHSTSWDNLAMMYIWWMSWV